MAKDRRWTRLPADWRDTILVCRKCSKKLGGGFGPHGRQRLGKVLRRAIGRSGGQKTMRRHTVAVIEVGCFDVCPKGAVVTVRGQDPGRWLLVPAGADAEEIIRRLGVVPPGSTVAVRPPQSADVTDQAAVSRTAAELRSDS